MVHDASHRAGSCSPSGISALCPLFARGRVDRSPKMSSSSSPNNSSMMLRSECRSGAIRFVEYTSKVHIVTSIFVAFCLVYCCYLHLQVSSYRQALDKLTASREVSTLDIQDLIRKEIDFYDADKTYQADYALEPSGGMIVSTKCSKTYLEGNIQYSINGVLPVYWTSIAPRILIHSTKVTPGECWAFKGAEGKLVIKLSRRIVPTSFAYEHIRKELSPDFNINSAPRHFEVKSLKDENDENGLLLGEYEYNEHDGPLQEFRVQNRHPAPTEFIELHILSNHGEMKFTCLYRFRVHGNKIDSSL